MTQSLTFFAWPIQKHSHLQITFGVKVTILIHYLLEIIVRFIFWWAHLLILTDYEGYCELIIMKSCLE